MSGVLVSVIVPVYNAEAFLERTVRSILAQTYENMEIILVDDGSTDKSGEMCEIYASKDKRIKSYHNINHGVSYARNYGLSIAHGEYVHFVDADDMLPSNFVELMLNNMIRQNSDVVFCGLSRVYEYSEHLNRLKNATYSVDDYFAALYKGEYFCTASSCIGMYKMKIIRDYGIRFPEELRCGEDAIFVTEYVKHVKRISSIKDTVYYYMYDNEHSATKSIYYDHYQQEQKRYDEICNLVTDSKILKEISYYYIDKIIRELVIYAKCTPESSIEIRRQLKNFVNDPNTKMAILNYHRNSPAKSYWIPIAIKYRMTNFLYWLLRKRKIRLDVQQPVISVWN